MELITTNDAAVLLNCTPSHVTRLGKREVLTVFGRNRNGSWLFDKEQVLQVASQFQGKKPDKVLALEFALATQAILTANTIAERMSISKPSALHWLKKCTSYGLFEQKRIGKTIYFMPTDVLLKKIVENERKQK
jgi:hypothetical protein